MVAMRKSKKALTTCTVWKVWISTQDNGWPVHMFRRGEGMGHPVYKNSLVTILVKNDLHQQTNY